jgi:hypothetical protein
MTQQSITVLRAPAVVDRYGNPSSVRDWGAATSVTYNAVSVQPDISNESAGDRPLVVTGWRVFSARGTDVDVLPTDRILYNGVTLEVDGEVGRWEFAGRLHHVEFRLKRVTG